MKSGFFFISKSQLPRFGSRKGITLLQGVAGIFIVTMAAIILATVIAYYKTGEVRLDDRVGVQNILLESVSSIRSIAFDDIVTFCVNKNAMATSALMQSPCFNSTTNPTGLSDDPSIIGPTTSQGLQKPIEVRKNAQTGRPDLNGKACIAIERCRELIPGQLIEITLTGIWMDPNPNKSPRYNLTQQVFRRVRW
jgi:hypothetical protein